MAKRIADEIMQHSQAYENLRVLCKKVGPRLSGSANALKAVNETAQMLRQAGADSVYLQPCMVTHWVRGNVENCIATTVQGKQLKLRATALGNSLSNPKGGVRASVVEVKNYDELVALGEKGIKGKIVFYNNPMNPTYINTFRAYGESGIYRRSGPSRAAKLGAVAVLVRSLSSTIDSFPHTGATVYNDSFPKIPAMAISTMDAEWLSREIAAKQVRSMFVQTSCEMLPDVLSYNVVGVLKGRDIPGEYITVGGHLDSWDLAEGANDDGTGCVQSIEIMRSFKALSLRPKRSIHVVMFMNEENGGGGGHAYRDSARTGVGKPIFALESDAGGFTPRAIHFELPEENILKLKAWEPLFRPYGVYELSAGGGGSDISPLKELETTLAGLSPDSQRYFYIHHAATDVFEAVSKRELELGAVNMAILTWLVSEYGL
ncbi:MAG: M28 family peptidase [Ferruginibacter sp.]